jgi:hypothetical protein
MRAAVTWVKTNCTHPKAVKDLSRFLFDANAAGVNCWFLAGGNLVRSGHATLVHCFCGELFTFPLTDAQAAARDVNRSGLCTGRSPYSLALVPRPENVAISLDRLELPNALITQSTPIVGRLHYEVLASGGLPWCVRLDYELAAQHRHAWDYPQRLLWGKGMLDISFLPIAPEPQRVTSYRGPLVLFARLCAMSPPEQADSRPAISNAVGVLVDVF